MPAPSALQCVTCQREYSPAEVDYTCPACGPILGTLDVLYDYQRLRHLVTHDTLAQNPRRDHWRYLPLLPIGSDQYIQHLAVGATPIYPVPHLASEWSVARVWIKDDTRNPTASFKDRASSVAVVKALEKGVDTVTAASTGNAASSWSAFTAIAGLETFIFVPRTAPRAKIAQLLLYGANVLQVDGSYDHAFDLCCRAAERWGWYNRSTAINPYLGEGKKTGALEICEQLQWQVPDYVFVAVGDGCILQGTWKGFNDMYEIGLIERLPKLVGVQAEGSAPLFRAWRNGAPTCDPIEARTVADSISVGVPRDQVKALRAVRESGGRFMTVSDEEILAAVREMARLTGVLAEPAGAAAFAGARKLAAQGLCTKEDSIVIMVTGHGLKDIDGVVQAVTEQPLKIPCELEAVEERISHIKRAKGRA